MMNIKVFILLIGCIISSDISLAQVRTDNLLRSKLDTAADRAAMKYMSDSTAHSLNIGIVYGGKTFSYHYGENVKGSGKLPSDDLYYNIGSIAKTFTGTLLAQAVIDKRIGLNDDIRKYLPGTYPNLQYQGHPVTVVQLANHTSALPGVIRELYPEEKNKLRELDFVGQANYLSGYNADSLLKDLHNVVPDTIPGTRYRYNTNGVMLLQYILERAYHRSYKKLITKYLQARLGLYHITPVLDKKQMKLAAQGYTKEGRRQSYVNLEGYYIGPSINATMHDLLGYVKAQLEERDPAIRLSHQLTWTGQNGFAVGLNWMFNTENATPYLYHDGNTKLGFNSLCTIYPTQNLGIFIIANDVYSQERIGQMENTIYNAVK